MNGSLLLIFALVYSFHNVLRAVFLSGWWQIAHSFAHQRLSGKFTHCIAH